MIKPNWKNSIVNVSATISDFLGNKNDIPKIKVLNDYLNKNYKNIVYICLDGMGLFPLKQNLPKDSFLRSNIKKTITSVFPATTTNATSSLCSASFPMDHGMFGWSLYLENVKRCIDLYIGTDSQTGEKILERSDIAKLFSFDNYFDSLDIKNYKTNLVSPPYITCKSNSMQYNSQDEMFENIDKICKKPGKQFIYSYNDDPDYTMHDYGVTSSETQKVFEYLNAKVEELAKTIKIL